MKKIISLLTILFVALAISTPASAKDYYSRDVNVLPSAAKTLIQKHFRSDVSLINVEKSWGKVSEYDVILNDGSEISFDAAGNWKEIETSRKSRVPDNLVPNTILTYIKKQQPKDKIVGLERTRKGYEVTMSDGTEMEFDKAGRFLKYDD